MRNEAKSGMRDLHSAFCFVFTSLIFLRSGGFAIHPYVISGFVIREKYLIQCKWFILIALQMLIFNAGGLQIPPNWGKSKAKSKAIVIRKNTLFYANRFILIALQMLIFNAGGLQLALLFPSASDFQFPLAADRWFPPELITYPPELGCKKHCQKMYLFFLLIEIYFIILHQKVPKSVCFIHKIELSCVMMVIERDIINAFKQWKDMPNRKPILLKGARQIGKTWAMEKFGQDCFDYCVKFDFDRQPELKSVFQTTKLPDRLIKELTLFCEQPIVAGKTLIIFDEIQECEEALNSLKYFCEDAPQYHIIAAGSLLGVAVKKHKMTVPVGKVKVMRMFPITFKEFLRASDPNTFEYIDTLSEITHLPEIIINKLRTEYRRYQVCGGMPEPIVALIEDKGVGAVDSILQDILELYEFDFSKYANPHEIPRIRSVWHSLPAQLSKENRKFIYKVIRSGARSKDYEDALMWLEDAGMIHRVYNISKPGMPLSAYKDTTAFKVYACDCGLLRRLAHLPATVVTDPVSNYTEFKGAMAENIVLQSFMPLLDNQQPCYWTSDGKAEVEFVVQWKDQIIPVEVKAEENICGNSLSEYNKKYNPTYRIRFSMLNLQFNGGLLSCPSPLAGWMDKLLEKV